MTVLLVGLVHYLFLYYFLKFLGYVEIETYTAKRIREDLPH